jgi:glycerate dehydrogenase
MNIVALDTFPINPGDLRWDAVTALGPCTVYDRTAPEEIHDRVKDAAIVLTNKVPLTGQLMAELPRLKYIGVMATGYNIVDVQAARELGIVVTNVPSYSTMSVAQLVFALLLELTHHVADHSLRVHDGGWAACTDFNFRVSPLIELAGSTMGIVGYGEIGKAVAGIASAFGMNVLVATRTPFASSRTIHCVDMETVFRSSDALSLHCPLTPETARLVNAERLSIMKRNVFVINTSRGPIVDEQALADALNTGRIAGAGIDVLSTEPPHPQNPLLTAKNCVITPHVGWATYAARTRLIAVIADNIAAFLNGSPQNVVS